MTPARILVVEDDRVVARDIQHQLTRIGHTVVGVTPMGEDAVRLALESQPDLVLMDIRLEGVLDGVDAAQQIRNRCQVPVVFLTAYADDETLQRARVTEPFGYLLKPFEDSQLSTVIEMALYKHTAERKLRESERRYAVTLASIGDAVIATDDQARVIFLNPAAEALTGWPQGEATGRPLAEVFHIVNEETRQPVEDPAAKVLRLGTVVGLANHTVLLARDGREVPIDDCGAPIIDDRGSISGVVLVFRDTTQRRRAEEAEVLRRANARLELALRGSNIGVWENVMPDGDFQAGRIHCSNIMEQLDYPAPESSIDFATMVGPLHAEDRGRLEQAIQAYFAGQTEEFRLEYRGQHRDGSYRWFVSRGIAVRDAGGKPIRFAGTRVYITDLKQTEGALRLANARLDLAMRGSNIAIVELNMPDGVLENGRWDWVSAGDRISGHDRTDLATDFAATMPRVHPDDQERVLGALRAHLSGQTREFEAEGRIRHKDGSYIWRLARGVAVRDAEGRAVRFMMSAVDITDMKRAEEVLRRAKDTAEAASRAKDEFLANVSHEIRTPMNAILGMTELALDTSMTDDQRQCLTTVKTAAENLLGIINDLLDFSKIEAGKLELEPSDFALRAAVGETLRALAVRAHRKGLELIYDVQPDVPDALVGDAGRLRQVLLNLVGNAIKFTEEGEVVVRVEVAGEPAVEEVSVSFAVSDTGIGISPDKQEKVFRAFEQEDTSTTRKYGGTGLGLSIAARLVALMGGTITVQSEPGRGSTFAFTAKFGRQPYPAETTPALPPVLLRNLRVLVVDDNATNRHILEEWLRDWEMSPTAVGNGVAAMDVLWDAASLGRPYPLVLLDARMPDTDSLALVARIRERAALAAIRIILLTSGDRPGDQARSRELRIDAYLLKPVRPDELLETIYRVMNRARSEAPPPAEAVPVREPSPEAVPASTPLHILVAEDNESSARFLERLLTRPGHTVQLASNGREALTLVEQKGVDLLLLDVHMPELDGFQVVQALRERELTTGGHLPIIALTARSRSEDRERCLAAGIDDFLTKPVRPADLLAAIDRLVPAPGASRPVRPAAGDHAGLLDPVAVLRACGDDEETLRMMCRGFQTFLPGQLADVSDALRGRDAPRLREAAHKLCALLFAFSTAAGDVASDIEDQAAHGRLDEARPLVEQLEAMVRELLGLTDGLSVETLRHQAEAAHDSNRTGNP